MVTLELMLVIVRGKHDYIAAPSSKELRVPYEVKVALHSPFLSIRTSVLWFVYDLGVLGVLAR